jgi:Bacterial Ig domain
MIRKYPFLAGSTAFFPRGRVHVVKAMALAALAVHLPAKGHCSDVVETSQLGSADRSATSKNSMPVAVTDYIDLKSAALAFNVLANDTDADEDALTVIAASAQYGAVAFTPDGLVAYAANPSQQRADEIIYVLSDGRGGRAQGKVIVTAL